MVLFGTGIPSQGKSNLNESTHAGLKSPKGIFGSTASSSIIDKIDKGEFFGYSERYWPIEKLVKRKRARNFIIYPLGVLYRRYRMRLVHLRMV